MRPNLLAWQWDGYPSFHRTRFTLYVHLVFVPAFLGSTLSLLTSLVRLSIVGVVSALVGMALSFAVQGVAHKREPTPAIPFDGPLDAVTRIFAEQFVTFPRFVLSGGWARALRSATA